MKKKIIKKLFSRKKWIRIKSSKFDMEQLLGSLISYEYGSFCPLLTDYNTIYVDCDIGRDTNPGTKAKPKKTIKAGRDVEDKKYCILCVLDSFNYAEDFKFRGEYV